MLTKNNAIGKNTPWENTLMYRHVFVLRFGGGGGSGRIIHSVHKVILYYKRIGEVMLHIL